MRTIRALLAATVLTTVAACVPTGHPRCDQFPDATLVIAQQGYEIDCTPPVDGTNDGTRPGAYGVTEHDQRVVYVWPHRHPTDAKLHRTLLHEAAHTLGIRDERTADAYAYCRLPAHERNGIGFLAPLPSPSECHRLTR